MSHYKPYPAYKDSGVEWLGQVPEHWNVKPLRWLGTYQNSNVDKKSYEGQITVRLCNYTDVYYNECIRDSQEFMVATASLSETKSMSLKKGDIIITKDSEDPTDIGIPAIVAEELTNVVCGYHLTVIQVPEAYQRFTHRLIQSDPTKARFFVESPGITRYGLNQDAIGGLPVLMPPPEEAIRLANFLDAETTRIDALITKKTRFIELLREKRQALITHAVTKGLDPNVKMKDSGVEWLGEVPEHWKIARFGDFCASITTGPFGTALGNEDYIENGIPVINPSHIVKNKILPDSGVSVSEITANRLEFWRLSAGDLVIARRGELGRAAIVTLESDGWLCGTGSLRARPKTDKSSINFLHTVLQSKYAREWLNQFSVGATMANLNEGILGNLPIAAPVNTQEQEAVHEKMTAILNRIDLLTVKTTRSIELLKERRSALITAAVTGQIDLRQAA